MSENNAEAIVKNPFDIPLLCADDIEVKVKQITEKGALALLYKTARTDMEYLDKYIGVCNWQCDYTEIKGNLYCTISIWDDEKKQWIRKQDCGIESREDGEGNEKKGEASDAFKRASTKAVGIGRELYTSPFIWLKVDTKKDDKGRWQLSDRFAKFVVAEIGYDTNKHINRLVIVNEKTNEVVYTYGINGGNAQKQKRETAKVQNPSEPTKPTTPPTESEPLSSRIQKAVNNAETKRTTVAKTTSVPNVGENGEMKEHERNFDNFLKKHKIEKQRFIEMRALALRDGKNVTSKSFKDLSPDEWNELFSALEQLYSEGYFKD